MSPSELDPLVARLQSLAANRQLYACIDLASAPEAFSKLVQPARPQALCLLAGAQIDNAERASPWLLPVSRVDAPYRLWQTCDIAMRLPAVTWFVSPLSCRGLRDRLARRLDVQFKDGSQWLLRLFDPRILDELHAHLEPAHAEALFAPCGQWCWLDRDGELRHTGSGEPADPDPMRPPLLLTPAEEHALTLATEAGHLLTQASSRWPAGFAGLRGTQRIALAKRTCTAADGLDLRASVERIQLLMLAAVRGAGYFDSPAWPLHASRIRDQPTQLAAILTESLQAVP